MDIPQLPEDQFIKVDSINTRYWLSGKKGDPIILVHGLGGYAENWMHNVDVLSKHFRVYTVDLVGFGKSDKPDAPYTYDYFTDFIKDFMGALNIEKAHLAGHSLGGGIVLKFALKYPEKVKKLVLISGSGLGKEISPIHRFTSLPVIGNMIAKPSLKGISTLYKSMVYDKSVITGDMVELAYQMISSPGGQEAYLSTTREMINLFGMREESFRPIRDKLNLLKAPVMVLWGRQDKIIPVSHVQTAEKKIKNVTSHIFDHCGHLPMLEHPEEFNSLLVQFLED